MCLYIYIYIYRLESIYHQISALFGPSSFFHMFSFDELLPPIFSEKERREGGREIYFPTTKVPTDQAGGGTR